MINSFKEFLLESQSQGVLYHFTSMANLCDLIQDGHLIPRYYPNLDETFLSLTRQYNLPWGRARLNFNRYRLRQKYRMEPFHHFNKVHQTDYRTEPHRTWPGPKREIIVNQAEERILINQPLPWEPYLISVDIDTNFDHQYTIDNSEQDQELLTEVIALLEQEGIPYQCVTKFKPCKI